VAQHHGRGGAGAVELAEAVIAACQRPAAFKFLYPLEAPLKVGG
jgi:formyltetrahydrofolate synthetase